MRDPISPFSINCHSSIRWGGAVTVWFDPFRVEKTTGDGDVIFVTHDHYDHFSPEDIRRVMKPGGHFLYVVPAADHLWEMKQVLYDRPYRNETKETPYEGFHYVTIARVRDRITLPCQEDIQALFGMTPYCWKTPRAGKERLAALDSLTTTAAFDIHIFERI